MSYNPLGLKESVPPSQKEGRITSLQYSWVQLIYFQNPCNDLSYSISDFSIFNWRRVALLKIL